MGSYGKHYIEESAVFVWVIRMVEPLSKKDVIKDKKFDFNFNPAKIIEIETVEVGRIKEVIKKLKQQVQDYVPSTEEGKRMKNYILNDIVVLFGGLSE